MFDLSLSGLPSFELRGSFSSLQLPEFQLLFTQVRDQLVPSGSPLPTEVSPYWYISRRGSNSGAQLISSRGGEASPDRAALTIADKQVSVLAALKYGTPPPPSLGIDAVTSLRPDERLELASNLVSNELEAYRIIFVYAQRKVLAGKVRSLSSPPSVPP